MPGKRNDPRIVLDTNVLISGILNPSGKPAVLLNMIIYQKIRLILEARIYNEYKLVLNRKHFELDPDRVSVLLNYLSETADWITPKPYHGELLDEGDRPFIETALTSGICLVTGNLKHYQGISDLVYVTPSQYLEKVP